jgi:hypothetical protein
VDFVIPYRQNAGWCLNHANTCSFQILHILSLIINPAI